MLQGAAYVEVLNPQRSDWDKQTDAQGKVVRRFDKTSRSHVLTLYNTGQLEIPGKHRPSLSLIHPFLIFQAFLPQSPSFTFEFAYIDHSHLKRRVIFCNCPRPTRHMHHIRLPSHAFPREKWVNICFDMSNLAERSYPESVYRQLESVRVTAVCQVRRVFTMKRRLVDASTTTRSDYLHDYLPSAYDFPRGCSYVNQYISSQTSTYSPIKQRDVTTKPRSRPVIKSLFRPMGHEKLPSLTGKMQEKVLSLSPRRGVVKGSEGSGREKSFRSVAPARGREESEAEMDIEEEISEMYPGDTFEDESPGLPSVPNLYPSLLRATLNIPHFSPPFVNIVSDPTLSYHYDPVSRAYGPLLSNGS